MDDSDRELREKLFAAMEKGGPGAAFDVLSGMGVGIEKEPEPGVTMRMRFGAGTDEAFTMTVYSPAAERPAGWPSEVPFLPDVAGSLTLFDRPGNGFSVQWFKVLQPSVAVSIIVDECLASGWRRQDAPEPLTPPSLLEMQRVVLKRDDVQRTLLSVGDGRFNLVQLMERRSGASCAIPSTPTSS